MEPHGHAGDHGHAQPPSTVTIRTLGGHTIVLDDLAGKISITHSGGCSVTLTNTDVDIRAAARVSVSASMVTVDSPVAQFSGIVKCDTLITNSVVSASYTPGAGNIS